MSLFFYWRVDPFGAYPVLRPWVRVALVAVVLVAISMFLF